VEADFGAALYDWSVAVSCPQCGEENSSRARFCSACGTALTDAQTEARKVVTILFSDVTGSTSLGEQLDPESLRAVMGRFYDVARSVVARHGGTVEKFVGDALMAVFGVPLAHEDDALRAVRAALDLVAELELVNDELEASFGVRLALRTGVNTGEVAIGAGEVFATGDAVNVAARLEQAAAPGEILLGEETQLLVAHAVKVSPLEPLTLKGKRGAVTAFRLESVDAEARAILRRDFSPLVGREPELERLRGLYLDVVGGGCARVVTLLGDAGIGKSRLARELLEGLAAEATVLVGRCPPYGEGITFWPLRELLGQAGRDASELAGSSREIFAAMRRVLEELARERPVIAVFDDVHWAEPTLLDCVEYLAARLDAAPVLLLCLARPEFAEQRPTWFQDRAMGVALEPLSGDDSQRLLDALGAPAGVRLGIAEAAEGNPLFVEQLAAIAHEDGSAVVIPGSLRGVLNERLDRLDREERSVLERAAVAGRSFSLETVLDLTPEDEHDSVQTRLLALVRKGFVRPDTTSPEEGFRFHHALIRDAAYDGIPKRMRADLHERVAARLEAQTAEDALVGYHLEHAFRFRRELGSLDSALGARAGHLLWSAGQEAYGRSDLPASITLLERARALFPSGDAAQPALLTELGVARVTAGDIAGAETDLDDAIEAGRRLGDRAAELHALVERQFARSFVASEAAGECVRLAREVMPELEEHGDELGLAKAWWLKSEGDVFACRWRERAEALEQALVHARRASASRADLATLSGLLAEALLYGSTPVPDAVARAEELLLEARGDRIVEATVGASLAGLLAMQGAFDEARRIYRDAIATYDELGLRLRRVVQALVGAQIELLAGNAAAAETELRAASEALGELGARGVAATLGAVLANVLCTLGQTDEAEELAREIARSAPEDDLMPQVLWRTTLGRALAWRGELEDAARLAAEAVSLTDGIDFPDLRVAALEGAAEVEVARGRADEARALLEEARAIMAAKGNVVAMERLDAELVEPFVEDPVS
jgi:class 3 adenylate cyclase/tetratricopeptide (TPR) repeat protein